jgi:hypothetical protein
MGSVSGMIPNRKKRVTVTAWNELYTRITWLPYMKSVGHYIEELRSLSWARGMRGHSSDL